MSVSPAWAFPVVVTVGMILSVWIANISMKKHKAIEGIAAGVSVMGAYSVILDNDMLTVKER